MKNNVLKGWELLKEIAEGKIKEGTRIKTDFLDEIYYYNGKSFRNECDNECLNEAITDTEYANAEFEIIEEQEEEEIEEIYISGAKMVGKDNGKSWIGRNLDLYFADKINEIIKVTNQLIRKEKKDE